MQRKVAYLVAPSKIEIKDCEIPCIADNDVLIKVKSIGICGSDVSYYTKGSTGVGQITYPHVLGHECSGEIVEIGKNVSKLKKGDRVAVEPGVPCGKCEYCLNGKYNLCESLSFMSTAVVRKYGEGAMSDFIVRPADFVYTIPDNVSFDQAAMLEPISVALHAISRSHIKPGQSAAILGCGPIAGCILCVLKAYGIGYIAMTDLIDSRRLKMKKLGASEVFNVSNFGLNDMKKLISKQVDVVFDTTCNEDAINASFHWMKKGGTFVFVGVPAESKKIDIKTAFIKELTLQTTFRYANTYPRAIAMTAAGSLDPSLLVSHHFTLKEANKAMKLAAEKNSDVMKIVINP